MRLTDEELHRIYKWEPYRDDWVVNRNIPNDHVEARYGNLIRTLLHHARLDVTVAEDGGHSNYLQFLCFPKTTTGRDRSAVLLCVSLCAPIAAYSQVPTEPGPNAYGQSFLNWDCLNAVRAAELKGVEEIIRAVLQDEDVALVDSEQLTDLISAEVADMLWTLHLGIGDVPMVMHGVFQVYD